MNNIEPGKLTDLLNIYTRFGSMVVAAMRHSGIQVDEQHVFKGLLEFATANEQGNLVFNFFIDDQGRVGIKNKPTADLDVDKSVRFRNIDEKPEILTLNILAVDDDGFIFKSTIPKPISFVLNDHEPTHSDDPPSPQNANIFIADDFIYLFIATRWKRSPMAKFDDRL